jgi:hypothetical protein
MGTDEKTEDKRHLFGAHDFLKPVNIVFLVIGILGAGYGIYAHLDTRAINEVAYRVSTIRIFDVSAGTSNISVYDDQNQRIEEDIFVSEFIIWNSGNTNMSTDKIRDPVTFALSGKGRIIDYAVVDEVPNDIAGFSLHAVPDKGPVKSLKFSWRHFDPDYGAKVRVIFSGTGTVKIKIGGELSGINGGLRDVTNLKASEVLLYSIVVVFYLTIGVVVLAWVVDYFAQKLTHDENKLSKYINSIAAKRIFKALIVVVSVIGAIRGMIIWPPTPLL